ncbi:MAG: amidohydrolase family protein [Anaerolineales bacterium]|nr:amidohydrolase family protein [Anaerolineales bacterium]MCW5854864.1 amidohydrolase family protein [Anaerolineales bacterium]
MNRNKERLKKAAIRIREWYPLMLMILLIYGLGAYSGSQSSAFLSEYNLNNLLQATLPLALVAMAQVNAMLVGYLDISVGAIMAFCIVVLSFIATNNATPEMVLLAFVLVLLIGGGVGLFNAFLVRGVKLPPIIATLATLSILDGVSLVLRPVAGGQINFDALSIFKAKVGWVPTAFIVTLVVAILWDIWLRRSAGGLRLRATGRDVRAARRLGIKTKFIQVRALVLSGLMAAVASYFLAVQVGVGDPRSGTNFALISIAAAALGGTSLMGGLGHFTGALAVSLFLSLISNMFSLRIITATWINDPIVMGALTIFGLILYQVEDLRLLIKENWKKLRRVFTATRERRKDYAVANVFLNGHSGNGVVAPVPEDQRVLIKGGTVLTLDAKLGDFQKGDILIEGKKIVKVAANITSGGAQVIDASNMIVMPGFVDTHRHIWEGLLRNIGTDVPLEGRNSYIRFVLGRLGRAYRPQDVYAGNIVSAFGAIDAGITTLLDWSHIQASPEHTDAVIQAIKDSNMRVVFAYGFPWWGKYEPKQPGWFVRAARMHFTSKDQLLTYALAAAGPEFTEFEVTRAHWNMARSVDARLTAHVGVGTFGQRRKVEEFGRKGPELMGPDTTYIHCTTLNDTEIQMIVDSGGTVSLAAPVEMMMGHGMPPTQKFLDRGLKPALSVDVETNVPGDMFTQMRTMLSLQHSLIHERILAGESKVPKLISEKDVIEYATIEGAKANGLDHKVGTLTPGKEADIILLRTDQVNVTPLNDPYAAVVWGMDTKNVDTVMVAGKVLKNSGRLVNVDLNAVRNMVYDARDHVIKKARFRLPTI